MSSSWAAPDRRPEVPAPPVFREPAAVSPDPAGSRELLAGTVTALAVLVCGPVAGLLWAALAPRPDLRPDGLPLDRETSAFIAGDGVFLAVTALLGLLTGLLAWRLGRRYGLGVVLGLAIGGLLAATVAREVGHAVAVTVGESVGELVGRSAPAQAAGGEAGPFAFRLRTPQAVVGWPVGALLGFVALAVRAGRSARAGTPEPASEPAAG